MWTALSFSRCSLLITLISNDSSTLLSTIPFSLLIAPMRPYFNYVG